MIGIVLLASASLPPPPRGTGVDALRDRRFEIMGFYCADRVCETTPRPLTEPVTFAGDADRRSFAGAARLTTNWGFTLNCAVAQDRLRSCRLTDLHGGTTAGSAIALALVGRVRLHQGRRRYPRAIMFVAYEVGGCPSWFCTPTPAPPGPPGSGDR